MYEDDTEAVKTIKQARGHGPAGLGARRADLGRLRQRDVGRPPHGAGMPPTDGWKKQHDDSYLKTAMEKAQRDRQVSWLATDPSAWPNAARWRESGH